MKHPLIVMFDFDGVIIDSKGPRLAALQLMKNPWYEWNSDILKNCKPIDIIRRFERSDSVSSIQGYKNMYKNFRDLLPSRFKRNMFFAKMGSIYRKYEYLKGDFFKGVPETLKKLYQSGIIMGICTNSEGKRLPYWLKRKGCEEYISTFTSRDDKHQYNIKPNPKILLHLLVQLKEKHHLGKIDLNRVYFLGDNPSDIWAAQNARIKSVAVLSGHGTYQELINLGSDYLLNSIVDIFTIKEIQEEMN